jgi:predicted RNase H-like nuclease (RuvC/YqgF family)
VDVTELATTVRRIANQNDELLSQNRILQQKIEELEIRMAKRNEKMDEKIDELIKIWRKDQDDRNTSWLSKLTRK